MSRAPGGFLARSSLGVRGGRDAGGVTRLGCGGTWRGGAPTGEAEVAEPAVSTVSPSPRCARSRSSASSWYCRTLIVTALVARSAQATAVPFGRFTYSRSLPCRFHDFTVRPLLTRRPPADRSPHLWQHLPTTPTRAPVPGDLLQVSLPHQAPGCAPLRRAGFPAPLGAPLLPSARSAPAAPTPAPARRDRPQGMSPSPNGRRFPKVTDMPPAGALRLRDGRGPRAGAGRWGVAVGNSHPACRRPRQSRADTAPGVQVVRTVARSTWTPGTAPAPRCVGRRQTGWELGCVGADDVFRSHSAPARPIRASSVAAKRAQ